MSENVRITMRLTASSDRPKTEYSDFTPGVTLKGIQRIEEQQLQDIGVMDYLYGFLDTPNVILEVTEVPDA